MNGTNALAAVAVREMEIEETERRDLKKTVPVRLMEIATHIFTLDWLQPDGTLVHQVVDFRGEQVQAYLELKEPGESQ